MTTTLIWIISILIFMGWNAFTVNYIVKNVKKKQLTPIKLAITFSLGFSFSIPTILLIAILLTRGFTVLIIEIYFAIIICLMIITFPVSYLISKLFITTDIFSLKLSSFIKNRHI